MLPELTAAVSRALDAAQVWALRSGVSEVRPIDLLCGLTEEEEGRAAMLLAEAGLEVAAWRASLPVTAEPGSCDLLTLAHSTDKILDEASLLPRSLSAERAVSS